MNQQQIEEAVNRESTYKHTILKLQKGYAEVTIEEKKPSVVPITPGSGIFQYLAQHDLYLNFIGTGSTADKMYLYFCDADSLKNADGNSAS